MEGGEIFGQPQRVPLGNDVERHADPDALGPLCDDRAHEDAVGHDLVSLVLEVVLGEPVGVEPQLLGYDAHVDDPFRGAPDLLVVVMAIGRGRRPGAHVVHLDTTE